MNSSESWSVQVDGLDHATWWNVCRKFEDANLYQTWAYETVQSGAARMGHLLIKHDSEIVAAVQFRLICSPFPGLGMAYIPWGPLWRARGCSFSLEAFRQSLRAVRAEFVVRRGLGVRLAPLMFEDQQDLRSIIEQEGFSLQPRARSRRTLLMDLRPSLEDLQRGLHQKWRYHLNKARKQNLELIEGEDDSFFAGFDCIYREMVDRKLLAEVTDLGKIRLIQQQSLPGEKMRVFLCKIEGEVCAGAICSALGDMGVYLFGATSNRGIKSYGSYLVHWRMLEWIRQQGCRWYDLNGINAQKNPGGYQFKTQLGGSHGREVQMLGQFDLYPNSAVKLLVTAGELVRRKLRRNH